MRLFARGGASPAGRRVETADFRDPTGEIAQRRVVELVLESIQEDMGRGRDLNRHLWRKPGMGQAQARVTGLGRELPPDDAPLPARNLLSRLHDALVLEDPRRVPCEDASRHVDLCGA